MSRKIKKLVVVYDSGQTDEWEGVGTVDITNTGTDRHPKEGLPETWIRYVSATLTVAKGEGKSPYQ